MCKLVRWYQLERGLLAKPGKAKIPPKKYGARGLFLTVVVIVPVCECVFRAGSDRKPLFMRRPFDTAAKHMGLPRRCDAP